MSNYRMISGRRLCDAQGTIEVKSSEHDSQDLCFIKLIFCHEEHSLFERKGNTEDSDYIY